MKESNKNKINEKFVFDASNKKLADEFVAKYPSGRQASAVIPLLDLAQRQSGGWLPTEAMDYVAEFLDMPAIRVYEVATFYSMFNLKPVGTNFLQICRTTPCWLRGSDKLTKLCKDKFGIKKGETSSDGKFTLVEVECLGACVNAPVVQINDDFYEDLTIENFEKILDDLSAGKKVKHGSQTGRTCSAPQNNLSDVKKDNKKKLGEEKC